MAENITDSITQKEEPTYLESITLWVEDTYLSWFGENRASYGAKDSLKKMEITGNKDIDRVQRSVGETVGDNLGRNGIAGVVGDGLDKVVLRGNV
ncbi:Uncharacterized protein BP5553_02381 [Venustampulla echinocandica]|uniref:Uncharacterized protein n=1 Tax=Venustampulla echinocandica TaxID=2656787 RepID=A0A370U3Q6_9HELO|nr:Uncharacterized protein BP5553_02381 [Venustampulla echinocandica]RDL42402.1 Uncharacterized protein BP5553_02381 [Venustampulla echinocandica]